MGTGGADTVAAACAIDEEAEEEESEAAGGGGGADAASSIDLEGGAGMASAEGDATVLVGPPPTGGRGGGGGAASQYVVRDDDIEAPMIGMRNKHGRMNDMRFGSIGYEANFRHGGVERVERCCKPSSAVDATAVIFNTKNYSLSIDILTIKFTVTKSSIER